MRPFVEYTILSKCPVASYLLIAPSQATNKAELSWLHVKAVNSTSSAVCFDGEGGAEVCLNVEGSTIASRLPADTANKVAVAIVVFSPSRCREAKDHFRELNANFLKADRVRYHVLRGLKGPANAGSSFFCARIGFNLSHLSTTSVTVSLTACLCVNVY